MEIICFIYILLYKRKCLWRRFAQLWKLQVQTPHGRSNRTAGSGVETGSKIMPRDFGVMSGKLPQKVHCPSVPLEWLGGQQQDSSLLLFLCCWEWDVPGSWRIPQNLLHGRKATGMQAALGVGKIWKQRGKAVWGGQPGLEKWPLSLSTHSLPCRCSDQTCSQLPLYFHFF